MPNGTELPPGTVKAQFLLISIRTGLKQFQYWYVVAILRTNPALEIGFEFFCKGSAEFHQIVPVPMIMQGRGQLEASKGRTDVLKFFDG